MTTESVNILFAIMLYMRSVLWLLQLQVTPATRHTGSLYFGTAQHELAIKTLEKVAATKLVTNATLE